MLQVFLLTNYLIYLCYIQGYSQYEATKTLASVIYFRDPRVVFKCTHYKHSKCLGREFKHGHCLSHNSFWPRPWHHVTFIYFVCHRIMFTHPHRPPSSWEHSQILWSSHIGNCQQCWCRCHYHTDQTRYDIHQYLPKKRTLKDKLSHNKVDRGISTPPRCHTCHPQYSVRLPQDNSLIPKHQSSPSPTHIRELK